MLITRIELHNVKSYCDEIITLTEGTNAICGENGAGKSTLLEAIGFALFDFLPYTQSDFIREGEKTATVAVSFVSNEDADPYEPQWVEVGFVPDFIVIISRDFSDWDEEPGPKAYRGESLWIVDDYTAYTNGGGYFSELIHGLWYDEGGPGRLRDGTRVDVLWPTWYSGWTPFDGYRGILLAWKLGIPPVEGELGVVYEEPEAE